MKRCPQCGKEYPEKYQYCLDDATELTPKAQPPSTAISPWLAGITRGISTANRPLVVTIGISIVVLFLVLPQVFSRRAQERTVLSAQEGTAPDHTVVEQIPAPGPGTGSPSEPAPPPPDPSETAGEESTRTYQNAELGFTLEYPPGWNVTESKLAGRTRVQIEYVPGIYVGMDVSKAAEASLASWQKQHSGDFIWGDLERRFQRKYGPRYRRLSLETTRLGEEPALSWRFTTPVEGQGDRQGWDVGTLCHGKGYALICSAPVNQYALHEGEFTQIVQSVRFTSPVSSSASNAPVRTDGEAPADQPLTEASLVGKSEWELRLLRNVPYARHGYRFHDARLRAYFTQQSWYRPQLDNVEAVNRRFSANERHNAEMILAFEKRHKVQP